MDKSKAFELFKKEIDSLCVDKSEPCTKGDLQEAMQRLYELLKDIT